MWHVPLGGLVCDKYVLFSFAGFLSFQGLEGLLIDKNFRGRSVSGRAQLCKKKRKDRGYRARETLRPKSGESIQVQKRRAENPEALEKVR